METFPPPKGMHIQMKMLTHPLLPFLLQAINDVNGRIPSYIPPVEVLASVGLTPDGKYPRPITKKESKTTADSKTSVVPTEADEKRSDLKPSYAAGSGLGDSRDDVDEESKALLMQDKENQCPLASLTPVLPDKKPLPTIFSRAVRSSSRNSTRSRPASAMFLDRPDLDVSALPSSAQTSRLTPRPRPPSQRSRADERDTKDSSNVVVGDVKKSEGPAVLPVDEDTGSLSEYLYNYILYLEEERKDLESFHQASATFASAVAHMLGDRINTILNPPVPLHPFPSEAEPVGDVNAFATSAAAMAPPPQDLHEGYGTYQQQILMGYHQHHHPNQHQHQHQHHPPQRRGGARQRRGGRGRRGSTDARAGVAAVESGGGAVTAAGIQGSGARQGQPLAHAAPSGIPCIIPELRVIPDLRLQRSESNPLAVVAAPRQAVSAAGAGGEAGGYRVGSRVGGSGEGGAVGEARGGADLEGGESGVAPAQDLSRTKRRGGGRRGHAGEEAPGQQQGGEEGADSRGGRGGGTGARGGGGERKTRSRGRHVTAQGQGREEQHYHHRQEQPGLMQDTVIGSGNDGDAVSHAVSHADISQQPYTLPRPLPLQPSLSAPLPYRSLEQALQPPHGGDAGRNGHGLMVPGNGGDGNGSGNGIGRAIGSGSDMVWGGGGVEAYAQGVGGTVPPYGMRPVTLPDGTVGMVPIGNGMSVTSSLPYHPYHLQQPHLHPQHMVMFPASSAAAVAAASGPISSATAGFLSRFASSNPQVMVIRQPAGGGRGRGRQPQVHHVATATLPLHVQLLIAQQVMQQQQQQHQQLLSQQQQQQQYYLAQQHQHMLQLQQQQQLYSQTATQYAVQVPSADVDQATDAGANAGADGSTMLQPTNGNEGGGPMVIGGDSAGGGGGVECDAGVSVGIDAAAAYRDQLLFQQHLDFMAHLEQHQRLMSQQQQVPYPQEQQTEQQQHVEYQHQHLQQQQLQQLHEEQMQQQLHQEQQQQQQEQQQLRLMESQGQGVNDMPTASTAAWDETARSAEMETPNAQ